MKKIIFMIVFLSFYQFAYALDKLAILPIGGNGVDSSTQETVYMLLTSKISQYHTYEMVPSGDILTTLAGRSCLEPACAADIGRQVNASKVVCASLNRLGEKIIFQYSLINVSTRAIIVSDEMTSTQVEDLDQVTERVAASIVKQIPVKKTVEVGLVTEQETQETKTRKSVSSSGIGFGYLYPQKGYSGKQRIFVLDFKSIYEMQHVAVDAILGIREGIALNIGMLYLPSLKDYSPYAGVGIGFHAISHDNAYSSNQQTQGKRGDGFEFLMKGGLLAFRTYDFRVILNVEYSVTLNDYNDTGIVVTIGVMRSGKKVFGIF
jgi:hypothetical protein